MGTHGDLGATLVSVGSDALTTVEDGLAGLLLLPRLCPATPIPPTRGEVPAAFPTWGREFHVGPPLGGQDKRWIVVSHDAFNRATNSGICVRTTSNTSMTFPGIAPLIENGGAVAVCSDPHVRPVRSFTPAGTRSQPSIADMSRIARCLTNHLGLFRVAGLASPPGR